MANFPQFGFSAGSNDGDGPEWTIEKEGASSAVLACRLRKRFPPPPSLRTSPYEKHFFLAQCPQAADAGDVSVAHHPVGGENHASRQSQRRQGMAPRLLSRDRRIQVVSEEFHERNVRAHKLGRLHSGR